VIESERIRERERKVDLVTSQLRRSTSCQNGRVLREKERGSKRKKARVYERERERERTRKGENERETGKQHKSSRWACAPKKRERE